MLLRAVTFSSVSELKPFLERVRRIADENKKLQSKGKRPAKGHSMYLNERSRRTGGGAAGVDQRGRLNPASIVLARGAPNGRCMAKDCLAQGSTMQKMLTKSEKADWLNFARKIEKYKGQGNQPVYFPMCKKCRTKMGNGTDIQHMDGNPANKIKGRTPYQRERTALQAEATKKVAAAKATAKVVALVAGPVIVQPAPAPTPTPVAEPAPAPSPAPIVQPVAAVVAVVETELERMKRLNAIEEQELTMMRAQELQFYRGQQAQQESQGQQLAIANKPHTVHDIQMAEARLEGLKKSVTSSSLALQNMHRASGSSIHMISLSLQKIVKLPVQSVQMSSHDRSRNRTPLTVDARVVQRLLQFRYQVA
jgi:hypothetical protein